MNDLNFHEINAAALRLYPGLLYQWFPGGVLHGEEYDVLNPSRVDRSRGSFRINTVTGRWADFATEQRGTTPITLYAAFFCDGSSPLAAEQIARQLGLIAGVPAERSITELVANLQAAARDEDRVLDSGWTLIPAPPAVLPPLPANHPAWPYHNAQGEVIGYVVRLPTANGGKRFLPITYWRSADGVEAWRHRQFPRPLPIYHRPQLAERPDAAVLVVEGEKTADAGQAWLKDWVVVTWPQGASSAAYVDWSPLKGRTVYLLGDHDEPGRQAMRVVAERLKGVAAQVWRVDVEPERPVGWDIADGPWASAEEAMAWFDRQPRTLLSDSGAASAPKTPQTPDEDRLAAALERGNRRVRHTLNAPGLMPVEPIPVPLLSQLEAELSRRVHIAHPLASQQAALAIAAHGCARVAISAANDPCSLYLALCAPSVGEVRPYLSLVHDVFMAAGLRESVRQQRINTSSTLYKLLYFHPALLYLSAEYGMVVQRAKYQPAGSLEQALNTLSELHDAGNVSIDPSEFGIKDMAADQDVLRSPTLNLLALFSQDQMSSVVKCSELGRGALEQLQVMVLDEERQVLNDPEAIQTGPFDPALLAMLRRLRRADAGPLALTHGFDAPEPIRVRFGTDMKAMYPALDELLATSTRAARPLIVSARALIRRVATVLAVWANPDEPVITSELLNWAAQREVARLKSFLAQFELLTSDEGKNSAYQKVLAAIQGEKQHGITARGLQQSCWAYRSLSKDKRDELLNTLIEDEEVIALVPEGKRALTYIARPFVSTQELGA